MTTLIDRLSRTVIGRLVGQVAVYGLGAVITPLVSGLLVPVYARVLSTSDFGELAVIQTAQSILGLIAGLRLTSSVLRVYYTYESQENRNAVLITCLAATCVVSALFVALFLIMDSVFGLSQLIGIRQQAFFRLALLTLIPNLIREITLAGLRSQQRASAYVFVSVVSLVSSMVSKILFVVVWRQGVIGSLRGGLVGGVVGASVSLVVMGAGIRSWHVSRDALRRSLRFALPLMPSGFFNWVLQSSPRYFLLWSFSEAEVGELSMALRIGSFMMMFLLQPIRQGWQPLVYERVDECAQRRAITRGLYGVVALMSIGCLGMSLFASDIVTVILSNRHASVAQYLPLVTVWMLIQAALMPLGVAIHLKSQTEFISLGFFLGALIMVGANAALTPRYGVWGAITAINLAYLSILVVYAVSISKINPLGIEWRWLVALIFVGVCIYTVTILLPDMSLWVTVGVRSTALMLYVGILSVGALVGPFHSRVEDIITRLRSSYRRGVG